MYQLLQTIDSSTAGRKRRLRSEGLKQSVSGDALVSSTSSKSKSFPSCRSLMNNSTNCSISLKSDEDFNLSLINYKMKNTHDITIRNSVNSDDISSFSNLSVMELIKTGKDAERAVGFKKVRLAALEGSDQPTVKNNKLLGQRKSKYSEEFLSNLLELEENEDEINVFTGNMNSKKKRNCGTEIEENSTTLAGGLYSNENENDETISSHIFPSVRDNPGVNKLKTYSKKKSKIKPSESKDERISQVSSGSLKRSLSVNIPSLKKTKIERTRDIICKSKPERGSTLGIQLSPDIFSLSSQRSVSTLNRDNIETAKKRDALIKASALKDISNLELVDRVRDCQMDLFDQLQLERPKNIPLIFKNDENSLEPRLIHISETKLPSTEEEIFETAQTQLYSKVSELQITQDSKIELFQDISLDNEFLTKSSAEYPQEGNIISSEVVKSKMKEISYNNTEKELTKISQVRYICLFSIRCFQFMYRLWDFLKLL